MNPDPVYDLAVLAITVSTFLVALCVLGAVSDAYERVSRRSR